MHTWRQSWWSGNHNLHWLAHPSPSAPRIHPRTSRQQWTSSCPKGQFEPLFHPETKGFSSHLFPGVKKDRGSVSYHRSLLLESSSGHSTVQDGNPGVGQVVHLKRANGLCPLTYGTHICTSPWQVLYRNTSSSSRSTFQCTNSARPPPFDNLPRRPGGSKGSSSMFTWTIGLSAPQQVWFVTQPVVQFHQHAVPSMCTNTVAPLPKMGVDGMPALWSRMGMVYALLPFKMLLAVFNNIGSSHDLSVILVALVAHHGCQSYSSSLDVFPYHWKVIHFSHKKFECLEVTLRQDITNPQIYMHAWLLWGICLSSWTTAKALQIVSAPIWGPPWLVSMSSSGADL